MESSVKILLRPYLSLFILVPISEDVDEQALLSLVREVNENSVTEEEWLSDNIYKYNRSEETIEMIS